MTPEYELTPEEQEELEQAIMRAELLKETDDYLYSIRHLQNLAWSNIKDKSGWILENNYLYYIYWNDRIGIQAWGDGVEIDHAESSTDLTPDSLTIYCGQHEASLQLVTILDHGNRIIMDTREEWCR